MEPERQRVAGVGMSALEGGGVWERLGEWVVLKEVEVSKPRIPVISNVDAKSHSDPAVIKDILTKQARGSSSSVA